MNRLVSLSLVFTVLLAMLSTGEGKGMSKKVKLNCKKDTDCPAFRGCHAILKICYKKVTANNSSAKKKKSSCACRSDNEYCHQFFNRCLPKLSLPMPRNRRKPSVRDCKKDKECGHNQYCHKTFKKCLNVLKIPTIASTTSILKPCRNDSNCNKTEFCHDFFGRCLVRPTGYETSSTPATTLGCLKDSDCQKGQFCHNMTHICLHFHNVPNNTTPLPTGKSSCISDDDCKISEFCHFLFGLRSSTDRHRRKCSSAFNCSQKSGGICIPRMKCIRGDLCRSAMYCLKRLGLCMTYKPKGEPCVVEKASFVSPCAVGLFCNPGSKLRLMKGKRLIRKLGIPTYIQKLAVSKTWFKKKYTVGKCDIQNA